MTDEAEGLEAVDADVAVDHAVAVPVIDADAVKPVELADVTDFVVVSQAPICDPDGSVRRMAFFNASGQRVR